MSESVELCERRGDMKKFAVFSGFLGSGKTTLMIALTRYLNAKGIKSAMISNDLGGPGLADHRYAKLDGCNASELTGTCICYQTENLVSRLDQLFDVDGCSMVVSDIPGFGIGALDHVYHKLQREYPGRFALGPFTVLCEPETLQRLSDHWDPDLCYILKMQLMEADLIILNKCDLLSESQQEEGIRQLRQMNPQARVISVSAVTGEGLDTLSQALLSGEASLRTPDLGYGGSAFSSAMGRICEYNIQYHALVCCNDFNGTAYLRDLAEGFRRDLKKVHAEIPHMKLLAWTPQGDYGKVDLLGVSRPVMTAKALKGPCTELAVILNASVFCDAKKMDCISENVVDQVSSAYELTVTVFRKECFSVMGES